MLKFSFIKAFVNCVLFVNHWLTGLYWWTEWSLILVQCSAAVSQWFRAATRAAAAACPVSAMDTWTGPAAGMNVGSRGGTTARWTVLVSRSEYSLCGGHWGLKKCYAVHLLGRSGHRVARHNWLWPKGHNIWEVTERLLAVSGHHKLLWPKDITFERSQRGCLQSVATTSCCGQRT